MVRQIEIDINKIDFIDEHCEVNGHVDGIQNSPCEFKIWGWAINPYRKNSKSVKVLFFSENKELLASITPDSPSLDVAEHFNCDQLNECRWEAYVPKSSLPARDQTIFIYTYLIDSNKALIIKNQTSKVTLAMFRSNAYPILYIDIVSASGCNANCYWCPSGCNNKSKTLTFMNCKDFSEKINYMLDNGIINHNTNIELYDWSEPFLNKDFKKIVRFLNESGLRYGVSTNASIRMLFERSDKLDGLHQLIFSMPGFSQASYDRHHGFNFGEILTNIRAILENYRARGFNGRAAINYQVYQHSLEEYEAASNFASSLNIIINPYFASMVDYNVLEKYLDGKLETEILYRASKELFLYFLQDAIKKRNPCWKCPPLNNHITIDVRGMVVRCCITNSNCSDYYFKNILECSLEEIINFKRVANSDICKRCIQHNIDFIVNSEIHVSCHCLLRMLRSPPS